MNDGSPQIDAPDPPEKGLCIGSLDAGGPGSISQLLLVEEFMSRLAFKLNKDEDELRPADYFDMLGGVGFGGLSALLLGRLRLTPAQAMEELYTIGTAVFTKKPEEIATPESNMTRLRECLQSMLQRHGFPIHLKLRDESAPRCKVVVFAATDVNLNHCHPFRTYRAPRRGSDCTFVEAACAILAVPELFPHVAIGPAGRQQKFAGIPHGFGNPTREVLKEAHVMFCDKNPVALVLSLGSGQQAVLSVTKHHGTRFTCIINESDTVARELSHQLSDVGAYLRLNVDKGMEEISISDWHSTGTITTHTEVYLQMTPVTTFIDQAFQCLLQRTGSVTLADLTRVNGAVQIRYHSQELSNQLAIQVKQMCDIVQRGSEKITLVDGIGNRIPIPMEWCRTYAMLQGVVDLYFNHQKPPGSSFVRRGDYRLVHGDDRSILSPTEWTYKMKPELIIEMSMLLHKLNEREVECPRCHALFDGRAKKGWGNCLSCSAQFQVEAKYVENDSLVSPEIQSRYTSRIEMPVGEEVEDINEIGRQFRLISVVDLFDVGHSSCTFRIAR